MAQYKNDSDISGDTAARLVELTDAFASAQSLDELGHRVLPQLAGVTSTEAAFLLIRDPRLTASCFLSHGLSSSIADEVERVCAREVEGLPEDGASVVDLETATEAASLSLVLYRLRERDLSLGLVGFAGSGGPDPNPRDLWGRLLGLTTHAVDRLVERQKSERQLAQLNTYLTVSSLLAQPLGLRDMMEAALYCSIDAVSAEAASVLMVDDEKKNFHFYQVEGPAKPVLMAATFPVGKGLAGDVFRSQQAEVVNDVQHDPRFYNRIDSDSGFSTRNMIAIPLTAGEERIGVLEVLNKADGEDFTEEERLLLLSIAEEIAFAIRNAKIFEYVVGSYCKQRQGQLSCRGCERPLGSWTPCVRYRESAL